MVRIRTVEIFKAFLALAASIILATVLALFSGVFYEPELAAEHKESAQKTFSSERALSQEELDKVTIPISEVEVGHSTYTLWDDFVAGFRQSWLWLILAHVTLLLIVRPRNTETVLVSVVALCLIILTLPWPNPSFAVAVSTSIYVLVGWHTNRRRNKRDGVSHL
jgi:uncharacterized membrane protein